MAVVADLQDYEEWHAGYDDPATGLPWRLSRVQAHLDNALDRRTGQVRLVSACAGDGRDVIGVLRRRPDAARVTAVLIELHPVLAHRARGAAAAADLSRLAVLTGDAGSSDAYAGVVPADIVVLVGIFGNISDDDLWRLIDASPQLCAPGATLLWSRGRDEEDLNPEVRTRFTAAGFTELAYETFDADFRVGLGAARYDGPAVDLVPGRALFTFVR